jgi:hypothetical protein
MGSVRKLGWVEIGSAVAVVISVAALFVSFYQARVAEKQAHASVWPYLSIGYDIIDEGPRKGFTWTVENHGLGPALIQSVIITLDGKPYTNWSDLSRGLGISKNFAGTVQFTQ